MGNSRPRKKVNVINDIFSNPCPPASDVILVACLTLRPGFAADADDLRARLARVLPAHLLPSRFEFHPALPLTTNSKIDRDPPARHRSKRRRRRAIAHGTRLTRPSLAAPVSAPTTPLALMYSMISLR